AAVQQHAFFAIDIGKRTLARSGRLVSGIVSEHPGRVVELANVDDVRPGRAFQQRQVVLLLTDRQFRLLVRQNESPCLFKGLPSYPATCASSRARLSSLPRRARTSN